MFRRIHSFSIAAALGLATVAGSAQAVTVGGVTFDQGSSLGVTSFYQNAPSGIGQSLTAVGRIDEINNNTGFCAGCELDFYARGFTLNTVQSGNLGFTGGVVTLFVNAAGTLNTGVGGGLATLVGQVSGGTDWLDLTGHAFVASAPSGNFTLAAVTQQVGGMASFLANALLDVSSGAGLANGFFNTNSFGDGLGGLGDLLLGSHTNPEIACPSGVDLCGSGDVRTIASTTPPSVPEPASIALIGTGLLALGFLRRRAPKAAPSSHALA
jgi:hypothetical protein